jgi:hypothetical protein
VKDKLHEALERADHGLVQAEQRARELILFADGLEEGGLVAYAQRARVVARDLLQVAGELRAERSVRGSIQEQRNAFERLAANWAAGSDETAA